MNLLQAVIFSASNLTNHFPILQLNFRIKTTYFTFYDISIKIYVVNFISNIPLIRLVVKNLSLKNEKPGINSFGVAYIFCV